ncbi:hypothetical protein [Amniculibacterium sp. G2-70]|uniref:hypothetical protein n=1 Tax=Amniculibacterium sp. G2-70 TaxID=2767188 RepID=UPI0016544DA3|nr:hypothetical protein [Amniculibacterium sp. G2-70]
MSVQNTLNQIVELKNNVIRPIQTDFIKHLVSVSVILVPLTSFAKLDPADDREILHCLLIALLACILTGSAHLYIVIIQHRKMAEDLRLEALRMLKENDQKQTAIFGKYNTVMNLSELLCVLSFLASVCLITILVW